MSATSKAKGTRIERKARARLERDGYLVLRAGGSLGMFDLIALDARQVRGIQVKGGLRPWCAPAERAAIAAVLPEAAYLTREIWYWRDYARHPEVVVVEGTHGDTSPGDSGDPSA